MTKGKTMENVLIVEKVSKGVPGLKIIDFSMALARNV